MSPRLWGVLAAAGTGTRFISENNRPKQYQYLYGKRTVLDYSADCLLRLAEVEAVVVAVAEEDTFWQDSALATNPRVKRTAGGDTRSQSVLNALLYLDEHAHTDDWVIVHDAARPCVPYRCVNDLIDTLYKDNHPVGGLLAIPVVDQTHWGAGDVLSGPCENKNMWRAQTPQIFRYQMLLDAIKRQHKEHLAARDEASAMLHCGYKPKIVMGSEDNLKITHVADLHTCARRAVEGASHGAVHACRVGQGMDVHAFGTGDHVILAGIRIPCDRGLVAHSDGDVVLHALCDAILGACGLGDIGVHFPDTDKRWHNCDSAELVKTCMTMAHAKKMHLHNADISLVAAKPKIQPYAESMRHRVASLVGVDDNMVTIKATTTEGLGFVGRAEGIFASAIVSMYASSVA